MEGNTSRSWKVPRWGTNPKNWLYLFILINLIIGIFIANDFGESTDEAFERERARVALRMYSFTEFDQEQAYLSLKVKRFYGTAQTAFFEFAAQKLAPLLHVQYLSVIHYGYFITFQVTVLAIFYLARHFTKDWVALATSVLFGTQPLLFGHAFINPKDIPQMAIFTATVAAGFFLSEKMSAAVSVEPLPVEDWKASIRNRAKWQQTFKSTRWMLLAGALLVIFRLTANLVAPPLVSWLYQEPVDSLGGRLFGLLGDTSGTIPLSAYINKAQVVSLRWSTYALTAWGGLYLVVFSWRLLSQRPPGLHKRLNMRSILASIHGEIGEIPANIVWWSIFAGTVWGLAVATRVTGLAAGGIVGLCLLLEFRQKAIFPLVLYTITAALVCYAAWPFLWVFGFEGLLDSLRTFSSNIFDTTVLFEGEMYPSASLPRYYLIKLIALQLTPPVVFLSVAGFFIALFSFKKRSFSRTKFWLLSAWFILPLVYILLKNATQYNNFRQYLFIIPPLFIFTGIFLEWVRTHIPWKPLLPVLTLVFVIPAIFSIIQLHPYQYIYYNTFTGGTQGAFREYPLDYWLTSYQHVAEWVDENIPAGSRILVWGGERRIRPFVKNEYSFINHTQIDPDEYDQFDYVIITTEQKLDLQYNTEETPIFSIERDHVPLVFVKEN